MGVSAPSPNSRTREWLRGHGCIEDKAEHWNAHAGVLRDLFNFVDIVAMHRAAGFLAVQATTAPNLSSREEKILANDAARMWVECGGHVLLVGWRKLKAEGWQPIARELRLSTDLQWSFPPWEWPP